MSFNAAGPVAEGDHADSLTRRLVGSEGRKPPRARRIARTMQKGGGRRDATPQEAFLSEPDRNGISARLRRLPVEFLLALFNATAILVIVAAILALVAMVRIDNFAGSVVATMTEAVLSKIDLPSKDVLANLRNLTEEVRTLGNTLREIKLGENPVAQSRIERLKEALTALNVSVDRLANTRTILTDEAIGQLGRAVTDTLTKMRGCASNVGQMQPYLSDNAAETRDTVGRP
jgi:hypothetical protein